MSRLPERKIQTPEAGDDRRDQTGAGPISVSGTRSRRRSICRNSSATLYSLAGLSRRGAGGDRSRKTRPYAGNSTASASRSPICTRDMLHGDQEAQRTRSSSANSSRRFSTTCATRSRRCRTRITARRCASRICRRPAQPVHRRHRQIPAAGLSPKGRLAAREPEGVHRSDWEPVDPDVTGTPVQLYHYTELLKNSYEQAAWYSLAAIVLLVLLHFRSPLCVVLSLVPVGIGSLWLGGLMGCFGCAAQSGEHHDAAAGHRHRRDQRHSHPEPLCRGADARASWRAAPARPCWCPA